MKIKIRILKRDPSAATAMNAAGIRPSNNTPHVSMSVLLLALAIVDKEFAARQPVAVVLQRAPPSAPPAAWQPERERPGPVPFNGQLLALELHKTGRWPLVLLSCCQEVSGARAARARKGASPQRTPWRQPAPAVREDASSVEEREVAFVRRRALVLVGAQGWHLGALAVLAECPVSAEAEGQAPQADAGASDFHVDVLVDDAVRAPGPAAAARQAGPAAAQRQLLDGGQPGRAAGTRGGGRAGALVEPVRVLPRRAPRRVEVSARAKARAAPHAPRTPSAGSPCLLGSPRPAPESEHCC